MRFQASPGFNYMPQNQTKSEGNDDQVFWGFTVMTAAEYALPDPPTGRPSWIAMAEAIWRNQVSRWGESSCGGGLRWQIQSSSAGNFAFLNESVLPLTMIKGYNYKNTPSNSGFMNLGARLYAYTANDEYGDWVEKSWNWMESIGLISPKYIVFDGSDDTKNCSSLDRTRWSYNAGMVLHTAAVM